MREILAGLPADVPLHVHLSEQPQENADCLAAYRVTPTALLDGLGALTPRLSVVHATHLTDDDLRLLGSTGVTVVMCPSTEADLGDGIGPARELAAAGAAIALGSDQNAVVDPFLEMRGLEMGERLASGTRGRFTPAGLLLGPPGRRLRRASASGGRAWHRVTRPTSSRSMRTASAPSAPGPTSSCSPPRRPTYAG